ncbi:MAG: hypothetical protein LIP08_11150 [Bacteroides sp.]|nr:hypothetical protein [Bacteroides sp.]
METKEFNSDIFQIILTRDTGKAQKLKAEFEAMFFLNPTLASGKIGYALAFLSYYEETKDAQYLKMGKEILFKNIYWNKNVSLLHGSAGCLLVLLYYYFLTKDQEIVGKINAVLEDLLAELKVVPGMSYLKTGFEQGSTGVLWTLFLIHSFLENTYLEEIILLLINSENSEICQMPVPKYHQQIKEVRTFLVEYATDDCLKSLNNGLEWIKDHSSLYDQQEHDLLPLKALNTIFARIAQAYIPVEINRNRLSYKQILEYFPRTLYLLDPNYDCSIYLSNGTIATNKTFCANFQPDSDQVKELFLLEKAKFEYEWKLRSQNESALIEKNNEELSQNISLLDLPVSSFLNNYFICTKDLKFLELTYYLTFKDEEGFELAPSYWIALKPITSAYNRIQIAEYCLQHGLLLIGTIKKYGKPIKGSELLALIDNQKYNIPPEKVKFIMIKILRKLVVLRLLTITTNAVAEKHEESRHN